MIDNDIAVELDQLAQAIARMRPPQNHNPHAFHEDRSELASRARSIAQRVRTGPVAKPAIAAPAPIGRQIVKRSTVRIDGRVVKVIARISTGSKGPLTGLAPVLVSDKRQ